ncbi:MAG: hypothetical protein JRD05_09285 [Deltaproteobacteria bacterium]|nr:hypothetical protein [Deltaproteobacteria bacterium]
MKKTLDTSSIINWRQIIIGSAVLLVGTMVYLIDRPPGHTYFVFKNAVDISLFKNLPNLFGVIGNTLPSFVHVFAFILITAGLIFCQKRWFLIICLCWFMVDRSFELGQKFNSLASKLIPGWFAGIPFLDNTKNYFLYGTFDCFDLLAIGIGTIMAYFVLLTTRERRSER